MTSATAEPARITPPPRAAPRTLPQVLALLGVAGLAWIVLGAAGTAVLASAWLLGAGIGRFVPALRGPAGWAAAVVAEFGLVVGLSAVTALVSPTRQGAAVNVAILVVPGLIGLGMLAAGRRRSVDGAPRHRNGLLLGITAVTLVGFAAIGRLGAFYDVAWAMSGDARNHALMLRSILADGGLTLESLSTYPAAVNGVSAVIAGAAGRDVAPGQLLLDDAHAIAVTYVLCAVAVAVLLAAAVLEATPRRLSTGRLPVAVGAVAVVAAAGAATPLVLGTTLADGFLTGYGALATALAGLVLALRFVKEPASRTTALPATIAATGLTFISWTVLVVVPATALALMVVVGAVVHRRARRDPTVAPPTRAGLLWPGAGVLTLVGVAGVTVLYLPKFREIFAYPGSIAAPAGWLPAFLLLAAGALALGARSPELRRQMLIPFAAAVVGALTVLALRTLAEGAGLGWTYYAQKTNWLVWCSLIWVPLVPIAVWASGEDSPATRRVDLQRVASALTGAVAVMLVMGTATAAPEPVLTAARGWSQPTAAAVSATVAAADRDQPYVFWDWSQAGDDKLANFWAALAWSTDEDGEWAQFPGAKTSFPLWAYFMDPSQITQLCDLAESQPGITVYTEDADLELDLEAACPSAETVVID